MRFRGADRGRTNGWPREGPLALAAESKPSCNDRLPVD
jgi:hypothetical protein